MEVRSRRLIIEEWPMPDRRPHGTTAKSEARWEETGAITPAKRCATAPGVAAKVSVTSGLRTSNPVAARTEKIPGKQPTQQPLRRTAEESVWQRVVRLKREEKRLGKQGKGT